MIITVPAVLLTLLLASAMAFVLARFSFKLNLTLLGVFLAANLLPPQALLIPIYRAYRAIPLPEWLSDSGTMLNSYLGLILINTAFQVGFCTFVLSNYMKALPHELYESARGRRGERVAAVLADHHAAVPTGSGRAGNAPSDLDIQRILLGDGAAAER